MTTVYKIITFFLIIRTQFMVLLGRKKSFTFNLDLFLNYNDYVNEINFVTGWYVTKNGILNRQNPYKLSWYDKENARQDVLKLYKTTSKAPWTHSGIIKHSELTFMDGIFIVDADPDFVKNAKFSFWLKDKKKDVREIDVVEISCEKFVNLFGVKFTPATMSAHYGTNYKSDHYFTSRSIWVNEKSHEYMLIRSGKKLKWYIDGYLAMVAENKDKWSDMSVIMGYDNTKEIGKHTSICRIKRMEAFADV